MGKKKADEAQSFVDALRHPLRRRILRLAVERGRDISPAQASKALDESVSNVSYHVKVLTDRGLLKPTSTLETRGAVEHFYLPVPAALEHPMVRGILQGED